MFAAGVDGCGAGWVVALVDLARGATTLRVVATLADVLALAEAPVAVGLDMPIGLLDAAEQGGREADRQARGLLGWPRRNSVFSPPARSALAAKTFPLACAANRASSSIGVGVTQQSFGLFEKLNEVDALATPDVQARVFEVHPELSFYEMAGCKPMVHHKKAVGGRDERLNVLYAFGLLPQDATVPVVSGAGSDDVLDALAACWTANRLRLGHAVRVPDNPPVDARGLRMEIWR